MPYVYEFYIENERTNDNNEEGEKKNKFAAYVVFISSLVIKYATNQNILISSMCANGSAVIVMSMVTVYLWSCRIVCVCALVGCLCYFFSLSLLTTYFSFSSYARWILLLLVLQYNNTPISNVARMSGPSVKPLCCHIQKRTLYGGF